MSICSIFCIYLTRSGERRANALRSASSIPILSNYTHNFIDSVARPYDETKDAGVATCTICFEDFSDDPGNLVAELKCS